MKMKCSCGGTLVKSKDKGILECKDCGNRVKASEGFVSKIESESFHSPNETSEATNRKEMIK